MGMRRYIDNWEGGYSLTRGSHFTLRCMNFEIFNRSMHIRLLY